MTKEVSDTVDISLHGPHNEITTVFNVNDEHHEDDVKGGVITTVVENNLKIIRNVPSIGHFCTIYSACPESSSMRPHKSIKLVHSHRYFIKICILFYSMYHNNFLLPSYFLFLYKIIYFFHITLALCGNI